MVSRDRREFLKKILGTVVVGACWPCFEMLDATAGSLPKQSLPKVALDTSLWKRAAAKGIVYGAASSFQNLHGDAEFAAVFARECKLLVPENELKWGNLCREIGNYDFSKADWLLNFAKTNKMLFRGHTLVWHSKLPPWFQDYVTPKNAARIMEDHISKVVTRYAGNVHSWDVVNEAVAPGDGRADRLRKSPWLNLIGPDYMELAFRTAAAADPNALLVYNDFEVEYDIHKHEVRREAVLNLLHRLKSAGTPIHALGIQGHIKGDPFDPKKFGDFLRAVQRLGLKIMITELDGIDRRFPPTIPERDLAVAAMLEEYLSVALENPAVISVITWGLSDRYSWLSKWHPRDDGLPVRPLPLDAGLNRKQAWMAMARAFDNAAKR